MKISFLTEGGEGKGLGHISRCRAIGDAIKAEAPAAEVKYIFRFNDQVVEFIGNEEYLAEDVDWAQDAAYVAKESADSDFLVIDSYVADEDVYRSAAKASGGRMLSIDDYSRVDYPGGTVVNPSIYGEDVEYPLSGKVEYLLGGEYIILRKAFWEVPDKAIREHVSKILVTLKGERSKALLKRLKEHYGTVEGTELTVVAECDGVLTGEEIRELMMEADICISGGGVTLYELARCGVPTVAIQMADNQAWNLRELQALGVIECAGRISDENIFANIVKAMDKMQPQENRIKRNMIGTGLVDGKGALRIAQFILEQARSKPEEQH